MKVAAGGFGRNKFNKYKKEIEAVANIVKLLPRGVRLWLFNHGRRFDGVLGLAYRYVLLKTLAKKVGDNVAIFPDCYIGNVEGLSIGSNVSVHRMCYLDCEGGVEIGDNVSIAHRTTILSSNHGYKKKNVPIKYQKMILKPTKIKENCWLGCGVVVLAGTTIETGSVIGANATVTKDVPANSVAVGNPARVIKKR